MTLLTTKKTRVRAIDILRGLTLFLMLFVNDLFSAGAPEWMAHTKGNYDGMGLADWVFPGFLFMVGISVPYAVLARRKKGDSDIKIFQHIVLRTASLLLIGVLILNGGRVNAELTGIPGLLWSGLLYTFIFLIWNLYPSNSPYKSLFLGLRIFGFIGLAYLMYIFRAGTSDHAQWLEIGWWGILGLIGWGYFAAATVFLIARDRLIWVALLWLLFVVLNILSLKGMMPHVPYVGNIFGVILGGNVPSIVVAGLFTGMLIRRFSADPKRLLSYMTLIGVLWLIAGFVLRNWFIISKIQGTPSWALICNAISILLLVLVYYFIDIKQYKKGVYVFEQAGGNSLTTYLAPDLIYFACWGFAIPLFFYKQADFMALNIIGSLIWSFLMLWFAILLKKLGIALKL